ncbi:MAG: hypothetical protein ABIQ95_00690, partial [Bdellovibrionia bacterium]
SYPFERMSDSLRTFERKDTHYLASQRGILYISIRFWGKLLWTEAVRLRLGLAETGILNRTQFMKGTWLPLGINAGVSATGN